ncbi:hypothetical protein ACFLZN_00875 [Nanoarchaeota archaeon]
MKGLAITNKGVEKVASKEIAEILNVDTTVNDFCIEFEVEKIEDLYELSYRSQSSSRVLLLLDNFELKELDDLLKRELDISRIEEPYTISCKRIGEHDFKTVDVIEVLTKKFKKKLTFRNYISELHVLIVNKNCYVGIDVSGIPLSKRDYRIFVNAFSIKAPIAYYLVRKSGYENGMTLLDPFCRDATIVIEAALFALSQSPRKFQKNKFLFSKKYEFSDANIELKGKIIAGDSNFQNISASKKNAKIAEVNKSIDFRRYNIEDLDIKVEDESVDCIVTSVGKRAPLNEFFRQAKHILKKKGKISILSVVEITAPGWQLISKEEVFMGKQKFYAFLFEKSD